MDREFFAKKIACIVNQAKVRKLRIVNNAWHVHARNGIYKLDDSGTVYILALFVEGKSSKIHNKYIGEAELAAKATGVTPDLIQDFNNSFCNGVGGIAGAIVVGGCDDRQFVRQLGHFYYTLLLRGEL